MDVLVGDLRAHEAVRSVAVHEGDEVVGLGCLVVGSPRQRLGPIDGEGVSPARQPRVGVSTADAA